MEINNSTPIFNPAAVVDTTGRRTQGNPSEVNQEPTTGVTESLLTAASAANGDNRLSGESAQAVANGAVPPEVVIEIPEEVQEAVQETIDLQTQPQAPIDDTVVLELSEAAQNFVGAQTVALPATDAVSTQPEQAATEQPDVVPDPASTAAAPEVQAAQPQEAPVIEPVQSENNTQVQQQPQVQPQDGTTAALSNTVDIEA